MAATKQRSTNAAIDSYLSLPFVSVRRGRIECQWNVPPTDDYAAACQTGRQYADAYVECLMANNKIAVGAGATHHLIGDMFRAAQRGDASAGYAIGFFSRLEQYIAAGFHEVAGHKDRKPKMVA